jgi:cell division protein FtsL
MTAFKNIAMGALFAMLLISALAAIYSKYRSRLVFIEIQKQEKILDQYDVEWGQLQLELTFLADKKRVEVLARQQLKMMMPVRDKIVYLKP